MLLCFLYICVLFMSLTVKGHWLRNHITKSAVLRQGRECSKKLSLQLFWSAPPEVSPHLWPATLSSGWAFQSGCILGVSAADPLPEVLLCIPWWTLDPVLPDNHWTTDRTCCCCHPALLACRCAVGLCLEVRALPSLCCGHPLAASSASLRQQPALAAPWLCA